MRRLGAALLLFGCVSIYAAFTANFPVAEIEKCTLLLVAGGVLLRFANNCFRDEPSAVR
jgi:hypothetical protein